VFAIILSPFGIFAFSGMDREKSDKVLIIQKNILIYIQFFFNAIDPYLEVFLKYFHRFVIFNKKCNNFAITKI
jgi:hypothetical protein